MLCIVISIIIIVYHDHNHNYYSLGKMTSAQGHSSKKTLKVNQTQACWTSDHAILYALPYSFFLRVSTHFLFTFFSLTPLCYV